MKGRFSNQLLVFFTAIIAVTLVTVMFAVWTAADRNIRNNAKQGLEVARRVLENQLNENARQLVDRATLLADDFGFKRAIATQEQETVISVLANHGERVGASLLMLLSADGKVIESTHTVTQIDELIDSTRGDSAVGKAVLLIAEGAAYQVVVVPVRAPDLIAWAGLGFPVDAAFAAGLKSTALADISFVLEESGQPARLITTLADDIVAPLAELREGNQLREQLGRGLQRAQMIATEFAPLQTESQTIRMVLSISLREALASYAPLRQQMLIIGFAGILLAALGALLIARGVTQPIDILMRAAARIGRGDYSQDIALKPGNEFGVLATTLNDMQHAVDERQRQIMEAANHDFLTKLPNRKYMATLISESRLHRVAATEFGLAIIGIGKLQALTEAYGIDWCDELLRLIAARLDESLRRGDQVIGQLARDQFLLFCDSLNQAGVPRMVEKIVAIMAVPFENCGIEFKVDVHIGFALYPEHGLDYSDLLQRATIALSHSQASTRVFGLYEVGQDEGHLRQIRVTHRLQKALLSGNGLSLSYQPKFDLHRDRVTQVEALLRWRDADLGAVSPAEFIPLAEKSGDILALTDWVLKEATAQACRWRDSGIPLVIGLNLSARDFLQDDFVAKVQTIVSNSGIEPQHLMLEITESATIDDVERAVSYLSALRELGFGLSMDDFGTGYSSLSQLKLLPLDELKIDMSFVLRLDTDANDQKIVKSTIELGHNLGLRVIAEGVENGASLALLRAMGCDAIQGYYLCKPLPAESIEAWWHEHDANIAHLLAPTT